MSINAYPIDVSLAQRVVRALEHQNADREPEARSDIEIVPVVGTQFVYVREVNADGSVEMHGREVPRHAHKLRAHAMKVERAAAAYAIKKAQAEAQAGGRTTDGTQGGVQA